ncbi:unnamed protein product [Nezara viridula]|uniref:Uncharacterized protein n=1 Tax=Nezara viridula TaxID=85310 RepID=A0A9P0H519_NEZVI|nr:unnamed protein product [Nezara viridula]
MKKQCALYEYNLYHVHSANGNELIKK